MPTPFDDLTVKDIQQALEERAPSETAGSALRFLAGDHWQDGGGWVGPRPQPGATGERDTLSEIRRAFISKNVVREVAARHVAAVVGRMPQWSLALARPLAEGEEPSPAEQALIAEAEAALTTWWDTKNVQQVIRQVVTTLLATGRPPLRLFVPPGFLEGDAGGDTRLPRGDISAQLARVVVSDPSPAAAAVITDDATQAHAGVLLFQEEKQDKAEMSVIDGELTVLRILGAGGVEREVALPLGGRLLMHELGREPLLTEQVQSQQRLLNLTMTMLGRNVVLGGFLERVLLNAQLPGQFVDDPAAPGGRRFVPEPIQFGGGTVNNLLGVEITDPATGEPKGYATPSVLYRDPVSVKTFEDTRDIAYRSMLEEAQQAHAIISGLINVSSESRRQAMTDFLQSLLLTAPEVERAVRWLLETALALAAHFAGQSGRYAGLRAVVACKIDLGPITLDDAQLAIDLVGARLWSVETGMIHVRVEDVDAEQARITSEREAAAEVGATVLESFTRG